MKYFKPILVLTIIALCSGVLLGLTRLLVDTGNNPVPKDTSLISLCPAESYLAVPVTESADATGSVLGVYIPLNSERKAVSDSFIFWTTGTGGYGGEVSLLLLVTDGKIAVIQAYEHKETPGRSDPVFSDKYLSRFTGHAIDKLFAFPSSSHGDIYVEAITGATRSSEAVLYNINAAVRCYKNNKAILLGALDENKGGATGE